VAVAAWPLGARVWGATGPRRPRWRLTPEGLAQTQGLYFFATGVWPLLHLRSFEALSGPKAEGWLVKTFGGVLAVLGLTLARAGREGRVTQEVALLAAGSAAVLAGSDVLSASRRRISPVYLLDAAAELALLGGWLRAGLARRRPA
jgi:hypothetical protein